MNSDMENNIQKKDNIQYFSDCTYYAIAPFSKLVNYGYYWHSIN